MSDEPHRVLVLAGKGRIDLFGDFGVCSGYILYCRKKFRANVARLAVQKTRGQPLF